MSTTEQWWWLVVQVMLWVMAQHSDWWQQWTVKYRSQSTREKQIFWLTLTCWHDNVPHTHGDWWQHWTVSIEVRLQGRNRYLDSQTQQCTTYTHSIHEQEKKQLPPVTLSTQLRTHDNYSTARPPTLLTGVLPWGAEVKPACVLSAHPKASPVNWGMCHSGNCCLDLNDVGTM